MNARQVEIFHAVMRCGTVTDAARQLGISQPAVSKAIRLAETDARIKLFRRIKGRLFPTLEAESLFSDADRIVRDLDALQRFAGDLREGKAGLLRVAASSSLAASVVPVALARFAKDKPGVKTIAHLLPAADVASLVATNQVDIGLTLSPVHAPTAKIRSAAATEMVCALPEDHPLAERAEIHARDLASEPLVSFSARTFFGRLLDEAFEKEGVVRRVSVEVTLALAAAPLVQAGMGVAILDGFLRSAGFSGIAWRPFRPRIVLPVNLLSSELRPLSRFAGEFAPYLQGAIEEADGRLRAPEQRTGAAS